jgi:pimeloyl-ACP methyl ester carboxylesterase
VAGRWEFAERLVAVSDDPGVGLFVAQSGGRADRAVLVIHGGPDWDHTYLRDPLARLGGRYRLIMPDIRGCGRSTTGLPASCYTPDAVAADLLKLLDALRVDTADVLGFSYGGLLAQRLVLRAPSRFRRLIIASSSICPVPQDAYAGWPERAARAAVRSAVWAGGMMDGPQLVRAAAFAGAPADVWRADRLPAYLDRLSQVRFGAEWMRPWRAGILPDAHVPHAQNALAATGIPALFLHGAHDMTFPASLAATAASQIPGARAVVIDGAGHMTHVDEPGQWIDALEGFLN